MSRLLVCITVLLLVSGCVTNAQTTHPTHTVEIKSPASAYTTMTVEGTHIYYRDLTKALPSAYRSAVRTAPRHHPEQVPQGVETPPGTTVTVTHFPQRKGITMPPRATRHYLKKAKHKPSNSEAGRRS